MKSKVMALQSGIKKTVPLLGFRFEEVGPPRSGPRFIAWRWKLSARGGRRLVLFPGLGDTPLSWLPTLLQLRARGALAGCSEACLLEVPGYLGSFPHVRCFENADAMDTAVLEALDALAPDVLVGHSFGGGAVAHYAVSAARRGLPGPARLVLLAPSGLGLEAETRAGWESLTQIFLGADREGISRFACSAVGREIPGAGWILRELEAFLGRSDTRALMASMEDRHHLDFKLREIRSPTWLIWGAKDQLLPLTWVDDWARLFDGPARGVPFRAVRLRGVGHCFQLDSPIGIATELAAVLAS